jgi:hypothetical protein
VIVPLKRAGLAVAQSVASKKKIMMAYHSVIRRLCIDAFPNVFCIARKNQQ